MRGQSTHILPLLAFAVFLVGAAATLHPVSAQGSSSLSGMVCTSDGVYYYQAPNGSFDAPCGRGIPAATLHLTKAGVGGTAVGATDRPATTDDSGQFQFANLADGTYHLETTRQGFTTDARDVMVSGATTTSITLTGQDVLVPGKILSADGAPIADARVSTCCTQAGEYKEARTASDGSFGLQTMSGWRSISVNDAPGFQDSYQDLFIDGSAIEIRLEKVPPTDAKVTGIVTDQDGKPIAGIRVDVYSYGGAYAYATPDCYDCGGARPYYGGSNHTTTNAAGRYTIGVYSGSVQVNVNQEGYTSYYASVDVKSGTTATQDVQVLKIPDKTAHITGKVVDAKTGKALRYVSLNVNNPLYGMSACSTEGDASGASGTSTSYATATTAASAKAAPSYYPYYNGCDIMMHADGTFEGDITPGYSIFTAYVDSYRSCSESHDADGSMTRSCGPEYFSFAQVIDLAADKDTVLTIKIQPRASPDATLSGYVVDGKSETAIAGVQVSVYSEENGGSGYGATDSDGSYKFRLRSGFHQVSVYADGYLPWQGTLQVSPGDVAFDIVLTPGHAANGGCCYAYGGGYGYAEDGVVKQGAPAPASSSSATSGPAAPATTPPTAPAPANGGATTSNGNTVEDLGGGLGPYDPNARAGVAHDADGAVAGTSGGKSSPAGGLLVVVASLGLMTVLARRKA